MTSSDKHYFKEILSKYRLGKASDREVRFLETYYEVLGENDDVVFTGDEEDVLKHAIKNKVDRKIKEYTQQTQTSTIRFLWIRYAAAALVLFSISFGIYSILSKGDLKESHTAANTYKGITPGSNKAILTLANGTQIALENATKGEVARQAGVIIKKTANGQLVYQIIDSHNSGQNPPLQNSISTPKGGQYKVILPDGTSVWLNAASSITYPTAFTGKERMVAITGEAYFEVAKNKEMPFKIRSDMQTVEVRGTHFNINAYTDENAVRTTLLEGSVKITSPGRSITISPGEQAIISKNSDGKLIKQALDAEREVAWKNGIFSFDGEDIHSVMRQISRWYNIDVVYERNLSGEKYYGEISRSTSLDNVFKILELNGVRFTVKDKTVTVADKR
jgi:transmembrane sensor